MFPAALAIVVQTFPLRERGKALAAFFGIAGGLTALGATPRRVPDRVDVAGHLLGESVPVAIVALILIAWSKPVSAHQPARLDYRGAVLIAAGIALSVLGFQQSQVWGWTNPATSLCIAAGLLLLVVFYFVEVRTPSPLMQMSMFRIRPFLVENIVLGVAMLAFVPVFFFASLYAQVALGQSSSQASLYLLYFFIGFVVASQVGGRMLDRIGAKRPVVLGCVLAAAGFWLWGGKVTDLSFGAQQWYVILAGGGMGFMLGPASTDAVNRASRFSYGEATGITQTVRNYAASLGLAILGTLLVSQLRSHVTSSLTSRGVPAARAAEEAASISQFRGSSGSTTSIPHFIRADFAAASRSVFYAMAVFMAVAAIVAVAGLRGGRQEEPGDQPGEPGSTGQAAGEDGAATVPPGRGS